MRNRVVLAEAERRLQNIQTAHAILEEATKWILASSSHEHLCQYHGVRARISLDEGELNLAWSAVEEAIQIAEESEFELFRAEHLVTASRIRCAQGRLDEAEDLASRALTLSTDSEMGYVWGQKGALLALAACQRAHGNFAGASDNLGQVMELQRRVDDTTLIQTERLLADLTKRSREQ
jgi:tetratricopeptide (TPR) repeat protein